MNLLLRPAEIPPATARRPFRSRQQGRIVDDIEDEEIVVLLVAAAER